MIEFPCFNSLQKTWKLKIYYLKCAVVLLLDCEFCVYSVQFISRRSYRSYGRWGHFIQRVKLSKQCSLLPLQGIQLKTGLWSVYLIMAIMFLEVSIECLFWLLQIFLARNIKKYFYTRHNVGNQFLRSYLYELLKGNFFCQI